MASADLAGAGTPRLEEFVAFNDELAALVRSGLPLEAGLESGQQRLGGRIAGRLRQGQSLEDALAAEGPSVPTVYRGVLQAGLRSGRLADAVETVSRSGLAIVQLRRRLALAAIYPAILVALSFGLAALVLPRLLGYIVAIRAESASPLPNFVNSVLWLLRENPTGWLFWLPALLLIVLWVTGGLTAVARRLPGLSGTLRSYRISAFAEIAAGLLEQGVGLDESLTLAADASGDRALAREAAVVARQIRDGQPAGEALAAFHSLPRFARWMISVGASQGMLAPMLRHVADWANRRGAARADWFAMIAPAVLTLGVGGVAVALFAAATLGPVIDLLYRLATEFSL